ncbi:hypothetical protein BDQ17DRAFT_1344114 [Cyathus striatus]|nr:hypothetical protein BDQ17DRAFT_1344114 [Cyathus striatus]
MTAIVSRYSVLLLSWLWLLGLDINLFFLVLVPSIGVNAACITSSFSSADCGVSFPTDSVSPSLAQSDHVEVDLLRIGESRWHSVRAVVSPPSVYDNPPSPSVDPVVVMTPFSILPIIAYTAVALLLSYLGLRLLRRFNIRLLPAFISSSNERIPQPVTSASRKNWGFPKGWNWSLNVFRRSFKGPNATPTTKSRPKPADLDLQGVELLPTSSRAKEGQLVDLSLTSTASTITGIKLGVYADSSNVSSGDIEQPRPQHLQKDIGKGRHLSRSSSVDAFPQFSSASNVFDTPIKSNAFPVTPPLTNTSSTSNYSSPFTPSTSSFLLHSPSPAFAGPQVATSTKPALNLFKFSALGPSRSPSPSLSLSTSSLSRHRRSKSLGGVPLKRLGSSVKGKEKQRDEILVDYSSSESSSLESVSNPPSSSLASSDVGTQRILPEPLTLSHSRSEGSYGYGPLVPLPVPLVDLHISEQVSSWPTWTFDTNVEDPHTNITKGRLVDIGNDEFGMDEGTLLDTVHNKDERLVDISDDESREEHSDKLAGINEDEKEYIPLVSVQQALVTREAEKLVDVDATTPENISPVPTPPQSPTRMETEEPKLIDVPDHKDIDVEAQQAEQDSWKWDEDPELDPWTQPVKISDLMLWNVEEQGSSIQNDRTSTIPEEVVAELVLGQTSEDPTVGPDDAHTAVVTPAEEATDTFIKMSTDLASSLTSETPPVPAVISDEVPASSVSNDSFIPSFEVPTFEIILEGPISPDSEIGVCLIPPTPMIHPVDDWDEDPLLQDIADDSIIMENTDKLPQIHSGGTSPSTTTNDIYDLDDTPTAPPIVELPPLTIPLITISSGVHQPEESEQVPDPDLLPLPEVPSLPLTDAQTSCEKEESPKEPLSQTPTPPASPPMFVVRSIPSSPRKEKDSKPAWSLRASDAPALGLASAQSSPSLTTKNLLPKDNELSIPSPTYNPSVSSSATVELNVLLPGSFPESTATLSTEPEPKVAVLSDIEPISSEASVRSATKAESTDVVAQPGLRRRAPRSPIDIALAMQLRPGLGVGADPAWMVRFLMTMFGWFAVLISGQGEF